MSTTIIDAFARALDREAVRVLAARESCSDFTRRVRRVGKPFEGPFTFYWHPWTKAVHDATARMIVVEKSAQMGLTETGIDRALYDVVVQSKNSLYVLPDDADASTFSSGRVDPAIETSPYLKSVFTDVSNVGHKRAGHVNLYVRGSRSRSGLKSVPCGNLTLDEINEMHESNVELVFQRVSGYPEEQVSIAMFSTPTVPGFGVSEFIEASSQGVWFFPCPFCGKMIDLTWPKNFRVDHEAPAVICHECKRELASEAKRAAMTRGEWVHRFPERVDRCAGYRQLSQLYSNTVSARTLQDEFEKAQTKTSAEQEFHNGRLGEPWVAKGARMTAEDVRACRGALRSIRAATSTTMGVDVGKWYHWAASQWDRLPGGRNEEPLAWRRRVVAVGKCMSTQELARWMDLLGVTRCVIDAQPETREVKRLQASRRTVWRGWLKEQHETLKQNDAERSVDLNRTEWLDVVFDRIRAGRALLEIPLDAGEEFEGHLLVPTRVYVRSAKGDEIARYQSSGADHYAFAMLFDEAAHQLSFSGARPLAVDEAKKEEARHEDVRDPRKYAEQVLEKLTGFKRREL